MEWEKGLPLGPDGQDRRYPDPHEDGGLPEGWVIKARYANFDPDLDLVVVRVERDDTQETGWSILGHKRGLSYTTFEMPHANLVDLYEHTMDQVVRSPASSPYYSRVAEWVYRLLVAAFDPTDPVEAGNKTVFALGGRIETVPKAAR